MVPGPQPQPPSPLKVYGTIDMNQESQMLARHASKRSYLAIAVLCYINLVNYMDWFVVAGKMMNVLCGTKQVGDLSISKPFQQSLELQKAFSHSSDQKRY